MTTDRRTFLQGLAALVGLPLVARAGEGHQIEDGKEPEPEDAPTPQPVIEWREEEGERHGVKFWIRRTWSKGDAHHLLHWRYQHEFGEARYVVGIGEAQLPSTWSVTSDCGSGLGVAGFGEAAIPADADRAWLAVSRTGGDEWKRLTTDGV